MTRFIKAVGLAIISGITFGAVSPAFADVVDHDPGCRRIISNFAGPDLPRAVTGLNNNQVPFYATPNDVYGGTPLFVESIGERIILSYPQEEQFVRDGQTTGGGVTMIAVRANNGSKVWTPLVDASSDRNGNNIQAEGPSNLGYCSVPGMW